MAMEAADQFVVFWTQDVPDVLQAIVKSLKGTSLSELIHSWNTFTTEQWVRVMPTLACLVFFLSIPLSRLLADQKPHKQQKRTYWITRTLMIRMIGLIYFSAFITLAFQIRALYGENGIFPSNLPHVSTRPTPIFSFLEAYTKITFSDQLLEILSWGGVVISLIMMFDIFQSIFLPLYLWVVYLSMVNLGNNLMNYGWEWLTLEIGFLSIFIMPLFSKSSYPNYTPPSIVTIWLFRWMGFRLLFGAGMSKLGQNASRCWFDLSCTTTHYFTQPMPNLFAWFAHYLPPSVHRSEVFFTLFEQLVLPFGFLLPIRSVRIISGILEIFLQCCILATGNYAWINLTGILPCIALFDDQFLANVFPTLTRNKDKARAAYKAIKQRKGIQFQIGRVYRYSRAIIYVMLLCFVVSKSAAPVQEMLSESPWLKYYDDYFFVTAQGLFGFINQYRVVLSLEYTHDIVPWDTGYSGDCYDNPVTGLSDNQGNPLSCAQLVPHCYHPSYGNQIRAKCKKSCGECVLPIPQGLNWTTLDFKNLPGSLDRAPFFNSPVHYRFDWEVWIHTTARMESRRNSPLIVPPFIRTTISKILAGDTDAVGLMGSKHVLGNNYNTPPSAIKGEFFLYEFSDYEELVSKGLWWKRKPLKNSRVQVFTAKTDKWTGPVTRSPSYRNWIIFFIILGFILALELVCTRFSKAKLLGLILYPALFLTAIGIEYHQFTLSYHDFQILCVSLSATWIALVYQQRR